MHIGNVMLCTTSRCGVLLALYVDVFSFSFDVEKKKQQKNNSAKCFLLLSIHCLIILGRPFEKKEYPFAVLI